MPKLLADFLMEQQEPFALEAYLLERGCSRRCIMHKHSSPPNCSQFLRGLFIKLVDKNGGRDKANAGGDGVSTASSSTTFFNSSSESEAAAASTAIGRFVNCGGNCFLEGEGEIDADVNYELRAAEGRKQLSPVSVLDGDSSLVSNFKTREESSNSLSQCKSVQLGFQESREVNLIDFLAGKCSKRQKREERMLGLGGEEVHLLHSNLMASTDEWNDDLKLQRLEISMEIENGILENILNEMVSI